MCEIADLCSRTLYNAPIILDERVHFGCERRNFGGQRRVEL